MSDTAAMLADMTDRLLAEQFDDDAMRRSRAGDCPDLWWDSVRDQGLPYALVEGDQGFDIPLGEGLNLIQLLGRRAVPLPLAETMIANFLLASSGLPVAQGAVALACEGVSLHADGQGWRAVGEADRIAWGRTASELLITDGDKIAIVKSGFSATEPGANVANMPRDRIAVDGPAELLSPTYLSLLEAGALIRALQMAGAMEKLVELTVAHVSERKQFGRSLSSFQAVQHSLARLASEVAAASGAAGLAADAFATKSARTSLAIAAARVRISEAAGIGIGIAHQLHGAIGFTEEHRLHWFTTALWSWRDEFGCTASWTRRLGRAALEDADQPYWPFITSI